MFGLIFATLFALNIALASYLVVTARTHARPWMLFVAGICSVLVAYLIDQGVAWLSSFQEIKSLLDTAGLGHLARLTNLVCPVMAGALIGAAIVNRAQFLHQRESAALNQRIRELDEHANNLLEELRRALEFDGDDPADKVLNQRKVESLNRLTHKTLDALDEVRDALHRISP